MSSCQTLRGAVMNDMARAVEQKPVRRSRVIPWLAPDLAMTFALTTLFSLFFIFGGATALFSDSDTGWHILNGERIISLRLLPHADPFSFSKPGQPWIAWEWGADVLMGAVYNVSGLGGIALLYGLSIAASVWMWFRLNQAAGGNFLIACLFFIPMLPTTALHWLARPHIFSWLFLLGTLWLYEQMPRPLQWRHLTLVAVVAAAWASLHASFFLAPLIALIYAAGTYLRPLIWGVPAAETGDSTGRSYILIAVAASVGTLANPSGWQLHRHIFFYLADSTLLDRITEFQSFNFHSAGAPQVITTIVIGLAGGFAALAAQKPARFMLSILLTAAALRSVRTLPMAALLLLPLANGSITAVLSRAGNLTHGLRRRLDSVLDYGNRLHLIDRGLYGFAIVPLVAILIFAYVRTQATFPASDFPVAACVKIAALPKNARIFASDAFGGYLLYRFNGERKVFFDGRSDFYGTVFMDQYLRLMDVRPGWRNEFNRWSFTNALLPPDSPLVAALEENGWKELSRDGTAVLLTGKSKL
jgi:hypothetical protein